jgi:2Fe-2S iron-sulfur cluster binding domain.
MSNWKVSVQSDGREVEVRPGETLFAALRRLDPGLILRGCRNGGCGVCKLRVVSGQYELGLCSASELTPSERAAGWVLSCKATPLSDLVVHVPPRPVKPWARAGEA